VTNSHEPFALIVKQMKPMIREDTWPIIDQFFRETPEAMVKTYSSITPQIQPSP